MIIFIPTPYICCWVPFNVKGQLFYLPLISSNMLFSHYLRVLKRLLNCYCVKYIVSLRNYVMEQIEWMIGKFSSFNCYLKCILYIWMKYINIYDKISCPFIVKLGSGSISGPFPAYLTLVGEPSCSSFIPFNPRCLWCKKRTPACLNPPLHPLPLSLTLIMPRAKSRIIVYKSSYFRVKLKRIKFGL